MVEKADVKIADVEEELAQEKGLVKACLFSLIVYAADARRANYIQELIHTIIEKFPCRIIFIRRDAETQKDYLHVEASYVTTDIGGTVIACDQIVINTSPSQLHRVPYLIMPYLVPDLPIHLLWGQNPVEENQLLPHMQKYATRLIFDSECSDNLQAFSKRLMEKMGMLKKMEIMDINWALISGWREILTQIFDSPEKIHQLSSSKSIDITYNDHKTEFLRHSEIRALYLQGWLAAQFQWKFKSIDNSNGKRTLTYTNKEGQDVMVTLHPHIEKELPPGSLLTIEISTKDDHFCAISRKQKLSQVVVHASTLEKCELPFTLPLPDIHRGFTFMKEIFYHSISDHYLKMLNMIAQIETECPKNEVR